MAKAYPRHNEAGVNAALPATNPYASFDPDFPVLA